MVDVHLLGPIRVTDGVGNDVEIGGPLPRAVLALLALRAPAPVPLDQIVEELWGDKEAASPEASLRVTVSRLRAGVGEEIIASSGSGYQLDVPVSSTDIDRFRRYAARGRQMATLGHYRRAAESFRQSLAQWQGEALDGLQGYEFAERAARQLDEERMSVVEALIDAEIAIGGHDLVIGDLSGLVDKHPLRERLWGQLMLALYRSGRQAEAIRAFGRYRALLADEMGLEPSQDLADLEERILLHDPGLEDTGDAASDDWLGEPEFETFAQGDYIVREGDPADTVYWIESGRVEVVKDSPGGEVSVIAELGPGRYFGELASLLGTGRTASVRAALPTTVSIHDASTFRLRLGIEQPSQTSDFLPAEDLRELIRGGQYLEAYDRAAGLVERGNTDVEVRYLATWALARAGATNLARHRFDTYALGSVDPKVVSPRLAEDVPALGARLDKDMALARQGEERAGWARRSAAAYEAIFERNGGAYPAVNAAFVWLVAGDEAKASLFASEALKAVESADAGTGEQAYWNAAIEAEGALILGDVAAAVVALGRAGALSLGRHADRATTTKQLRRICAMRGIDPGLLDPIHNPTVVHYCGHLISPPGHDGRFIASDEERVRAELGDVFERVNAGYGYGSLAAGADILAAEVLLDRGAQLSVVLPFDRDEFIRTSVFPAGPAWVERFERCLAGAESVVIASAGGYLDDPILFDFCSRIAMGDAIIRADYLATDAHQVSVWDEIVTDGHAGTSVDVAHWGATGRASTVISVTPGQAAVGHEPEWTRQVRGVVIGDFAGYSRLNERQLVAFQEEVINKIAEALVPFSEQILSGRTWGDALYLVFEDVEAAADCALLLRDTAHQIDYAALGLDPIRGLRLAAHATPVFEGWDPISDSRLFYGVGVTKTARIEPRTPEGEIYTTHPFAALAVLGGNDSFDCQYVGTLSTAKSFGPLPLYSLRRRL